MTKTQVFAQLVLEELVPAYRKIAAGEKTDRPCVCSLRTRAGFPVECTGCPARNKKHEECSILDSEGYQYLLFLSAYNLRHEAWYKHPPGTKIRKDLKEVYGLTITQARAKARRHAKAWEDWAKKKLKRR